MLSCKVLCVQHFLNEASFHLSLSVFTSVTDTRVGHFLVGKVCRCCEVYTTAKRNNNMNSLWLRSFFSKGWKANKNVFKNCTSCMDETSASWHSVQILSPINYSFWGFFLKFGLVYASVWGVSHCVQLKYIRLRSYESCVALPLCVCRQGDKHLLAWRATGLAFTDLNLFCSLRYAIGWRAFDLDTWQPTGKHEVISTGSSVWLCMGVLCVGRAGKRGKKLNREKTLAIELSANDISPLLAIFCYRSSVTTSKHFSDLVTPTTVGCHRVKTNMKRLFWSYIFHLVLESLVKTGNPLSRYENCLSIVGKRRLAHFVFFYICLHSAVVER